MSARLLTTRRFAPLFWTQLFGSLNDNLFKSALVVSVTVGAAARDGEWIVNFAPALLIFPFFVFSATAGQIADRFEKARLVRALKWAELGIVALAAIALHTNSIPLLLATLFLLGAQAAFFGPLKYGILPQHLEAKELVGGNGLVEMGTFLSILAGTVVGGLLIAMPFGATITSIALLAIAVLGVISSRMIPEAPASSPNLRIDPNVVRATWRLVVLASKNRPAWRAILGASWFWFLGAILLAQLPLIAAQVLGPNEHAITLLMAVFSVGVGLGSVACERISGGRLELGWVPFASIALFGLLVHFALRLMGQPPATSVPTWMLVDLFAIGVAGGVFVVPLYALMQERSAPEERSRIIAANNIVNAIFIVASAGLAIGLRALGLSLAQLLLVTAALHLIATVIVAMLVREYFVRLIFLALVHIVYRVRSEGLKNVPDHGPALVVANHVSYADAVVLGALCRRPIRFVMDRRMYNKFFLRWFLQILRTIPITSKKEDPACLERAFEEIDRALEDGDVVAIFPEGKLTRDGEVDVFRPGVDRILEKRPVPVVPVALRGFWGSLSSFKGGKPFEKWPQRFFSKIEVIAGEPIAPEHADAESLRSRVMSLRGAHR